MKLSTLLIGVAGASLLAAGIAFGFHQRRLQNAAANDVPARPQSQAPNTPSAATSSNGAPESSAGVTTPDSTGGTAVKVAMKNVDFHLTDKIVVHIDSLEGKLAPKPGQIPVFDDKQSFALDADEAKVSVTTQALANDLNDFVFAKHDSPLKNLSVSTKGNQLVIKGLLASKGDLPFETDGTVSVTPEGMIRVHTAKVKALHLPVKGLMDMLGVETSNLLNTKKVQGVTVDKDDLILDPEQVFPPPQIRGHLISIAVRNGEMALEFRSPNAAPMAETTQAANTCSAQNFLAFKGGSVRFGRLTMNDSDLELIDSTPADPFDFSIDHYQQQLTAGYSKMTLQGGLCVHVLDLDKIQASANTKPQQPAAGN
jgi:hypothetical protein